MSKYINELLFNFTCNNYNKHLFKKQAYILGHLINNIHLSYNNENLIMKLEFLNSNILNLIKELLDKNLFNNNTIYSNTICKNYINILHLNNINDNLVKFPNLYLNNSEEFFWDFIRGYFENNGYIKFNNNIPECILYFTNTELLNDFKNYIKIPFLSSYNKINFASTNCIDFLGLIYKNKNNLYDKNLYNQFENIINWKFIINNNHKLDCCKIYKTDSNAILPSKHHESDVGYDLTIIKKVKNLTPSTILYDTGIKLNVDYGYYIEIVPRSSLSKSGYILANSIGIIEKSYNGNLYVALTKIDKDMPDLQLPFRCCQLIFKPQISLNIVEITNKNIDLTTRNNGGFGSSNN